MWDEKPIRLSMLGFKWIHGKVGDHYIQVHGYVPFEVYLGVIWLFRGTKHH